MVFGLANDVADGVECGDMDLHENPMVHNIQIRNDVFTHNSFLDFGLFISFIGSTCCSLLAFILPTLFYYRICWYVVVMYVNIILYFNIIDSGPKISITLGFLLSGIFLIGLLSMIIGTKDVLGHILTR